MDVTAGLDRLAPDVQSALQDAVANGEFASASEVVAAALQEWAQRRRDDASALAGLRASIDQGLAEFENGNTVPFDLDDIKQRGRLRSSTRSGSV